MKLIDEYFERKEEVHNYFGYVEDWVSIPLEDGRDYYCIWSKMIVGMVGFISETQGTK